MLKTFKYKERKTQKSQLQCSKCQVFGHLANGCTKDIKCKICAQEHHTAEHVCKICYNRDEICSHSQEKCSNCGESHRSDSSRCVFSQRKRKHSPDQAKTQNKRSSQVITVEVPMKHY